MDNTVDRIYKLYCNYIQNTNKKPIKLQISVELYEKLRMELANTSTYANTTLETQDEFMGMLIVICFDREANYLGVL